MDAPPSSPTTAPGSAVRERLRALQPENLRALDRMVGQAAWSS